MADEETRCVGCGKIIDVGDDVARVGMGRLTSTGVKEKEQWGILHRSCFNRAIGSPDAVLEELAALRTKRKKSL